MLYDRPMLLSDLIVNTASYLRFIKFGGDAGWVGKAPTHAMAILTPNIKN